MLPQTLKGGTFSFPLTPETGNSIQGIYQTLFNLRASLSQWIQLCSVTVNANLNVSAPTTGRPTAAQLEILNSSGVGYSLFDTTLGVPIWWNGTAWVNASGIAV